MPPGHGYPGNQNRVANGTDLAVSRPCHKRPRTGVKHGSDGAQAGGGVVAVA